MYERAVKMGGIGNYVAVELANAEPVDDEVLARARAGDVADFGSLGVDERRKFGPEIDRWLCGQFGVRLGSTLEVPAKSVVVVSID